MKKNKGYYIISWWQHITIEIDCWWRDLLRLPSKTESRWIRIRIGINKNDLDINNYINTKFFDREIRFVEIYYSPTGDLYKPNLVDNPAFGHSWEGFAKKE